MRKFSFRGKVAIAASALAFGLLIAVFCWPTPDYDLERVHPSLRSLARPYRSVETGYYLDGGSIGITIVDAKGQVLELALPVEDGSWYPAGWYPQLFIGATTENSPGAVEVDFSEDTRAMLFAIIEEYDSSADDSLAALIAFRASPRDLARGVWMTIGRYLD